MLKPQALAPAAWIVAILGFGTTWASDGRAIYEARCASCHGPAGEGSRAYAKPLTGSRSAAQLARYVEESMPEDDPGSCSGEDARAVSSYLHDAFYSRAAQARLHPPRAGLARLTVRQYRNTLADLVGSFRDGSWWDPRQGLQAEYFRGTNVWKKDDRVLERIDPEVRFDFGTAAPLPGDARLRSYEFAIAWRGSVFAPETGEYDFIVETENATRLWLNDPKKPLIDALVRSGGATEHRASIFLVGGRPYPLRLEFLKAKQGVDDSEEKKAKAPPVRAAIALRWKPPGQAAGVIPAHRLSPANNPVVFAASTAFPPDDRSVGFERGTTVSKEWEAATTDGAIEAADYIQARLGEFAGVDGNPPDRAAKLKGFARTLAERAFRRPLAEDVARLYVDRIFDGQGDPDRALRRSILLILKSPRFLYREVGGPDGFDVASRISYALWDAPPDRALREAAASGQLATPDQVREQAWRMVGDLKARSKLRDFFFQWLRVEQAPDLAKSPAAFPDFDPSIASDLRVSLGLQVDEVLADGRADFRRLLTDDGLYLNGRLGRFYGVDLGDDAPFRRVKLDGDARRGVLTHPYILANLAYGDATSPIHRGVFIARSVLGRGLRPPPVAVAPLAPDLHAGMSTRERVALQTSPSACASCHGMINPLGFGLEAYDAVGRLRTADAGRAVDPSGSYEDPSGEVRSYRGAAELAEILAGSGETSRALVEQLFHHLIKQPILAYGPDLPERLAGKFAEDGCSLRKLSVDIVMATAFGPPSDSPRP